MISKPVVTAAVFNSYFQTLFTSSSPQNIDTVMDSIPARVTYDMKAELIKPCSEEKFIQHLHK